MSVKMKDSGIAWIGEIPKHWEVSLLSSLFFEHSLKNVGMQENNLLSLSYGKIIRKNIEENGGLLPASFEGYNIISPNDIVFRLTDLQNDKRSLRTGLCTEKGIITSAYITIRKRDCSLSSRYFHYLLHSYDECKVFYGIGNGVRQGMNYQDLRKLLLVFPPHKEEQSLIANFLDKKCAEIDELIALQDQMIAQLTTYKQTVVTETVTKGLDPNVKMKDSGVEWIGEIPEHWEVAKLKRKLSLLNGRAYADKELLEEGKYIILRVGNLFTSDKWYYSDLELEENKYCDKGDLLYAWSASIGPLIWYGEKVIYHYHIWKVLFGDNDIKFIFYLLTALTNAKRQDMHGSAMQHLTKINMDNSWCSFPQIPEQQSISNYLDQKCKEIDELISVKKEKIEQLKAYKKSVIFEYVTGKKQVV